MRHEQSAGNVARDAADAAGLGAIDIAARHVDVALSDPNKSLSRPAPRFPDEDVVTMKCSACGSRNIDTRPELALAVWRRNDPRPQSTVVLPGLEHSHFLCAIRTTFPEGPLLLFASNFSGVIKPTFTQAL